MKRAGTWLVLAFAAVVATLNTGCTTTASLAVPSLKYCHAVDYTRRGENFTIQAACKMPGASKQETE